MSELILHFCYSIEGLTLVELTKEDQVVGLDEKHERLFMMPRKILQTLLENQK